MNIYENIALSSTELNESEHEDNMSDEGGWDEPWDFGAMEDLDDMMTMVETFVPDDMNDFDITENASELLDILGGGVRAQEDKPKFIRKSVVPNFIKISKRHDVKYKPVRYEEEGTVIISIYDGIVKIINENNELIIGKSSKQVEFDIELDNDAYRNAEIYSEEVNGKGSGLGFSVFVHSIAIMALSNVDSIIEPVEGYDLRLNGFTVEVTGQMWKTRRSGADIVINKYPIVDMLFGRFDDVYDLMKASIAEDDGDTSFFSRGSFFQGESEYTPTFDRLHELLRDIPTPDFEKFSNSFLSWYSRQDPDTVLPERQILNTDILDARLEKSCKVIDGKLSVPAPFRILPSTVDSDILLDKEVVRPMLSGWLERTHFHTFELSEDQSPYFVMKPEVVIETPFKDKNSYSYVFNQLMNFTLFQSVYIESELCSKIQGKEGCFYSKYSKCGIAWKIMRNNSLTYYACYYRLGKPPRTCGKWTLHDEMLDLWISPNFKTSLSDIAFSKILPYRVFTMAYASIAYTNRRERKFIFQRMMVMLSTWRWSTWQTSAIAGDFRFMTLCAMSGSGDVQSMINKASANLLDHASNPDIQCLKIIKDFVKRYNAGPIVNTPLFDLPRRFICLEKDLTQGMMWNMRKARHATDCFKKLAQGVKEELVFRTDLINYYKKQVAFLEKTFNEGTCQDEYDDLLDSRPLIPHLNLIVFIGLTHLSAKTLDAGRRQEPAGINLKNIVSDSHAVGVSDTTRVDGITITNPRVADNLISVLNDYDKPNGIHTLLIRMTKGKKIVNIYLVHPKNSKSKNREIPQMTGHMRIAQFFSESAIKVYTDAEDIDMMQDSAKYATFADEFSDIMRKGGRARSEDKSFFCGYMHPEAMALTIATVARTLGSTTMISSASLLRADTMRYTVLPRGCSPDIIEGIKERYFVNVKTGKKIIGLLAVKNIIHFMQGVRAMGGALTNTAFSAGLDEVQKLLAPDIEKTAVFTTSDDSVRGVVIKRDSSFNPVEVASDYINMPPKLVPMCMMLDSADKPIESQVIGEFNNAAVGPHGLLPQQFIHAHLSIQPLNGESLIDDIIMAVSNARSTLAWGDSLDLARASMHSYMILLMQRWLISRVEMDALYDFGIIPINDEELIGGFSVRNDEVKVRLLRMVDPKVKEDVISGKLNLIDALRTFKIFKPGKRSRIIYCNYEDGNEKLKFAFEQINSARRIRGRKAAMISRPPQYSDRVVAKNDFFNALTKIDVDPSIEELEAVKRMPTRPTVVIACTVPKKTDFKPCTQGQVYNKDDDINFKGIIMKRRMNRILTHALTDQEQDIVDKSDEDFNRWLHMQATKKDYEGFSFKSATGRPLMRFQNDVLYTRPMAFSFYLDLDVPNRKIRTLTFQDNIYNDLQLCHWGNNTISKLQPNDIMAIGFQKFGIDYHVFYQRSNKRLQRQIVRVPNTTRVLRIQKIGFYVVCPISKDFTPIRMNSDYELGDTYHTSNIVGDVNAVYNYGDYIQSNKRHAIATMSKIFKKHNSVFPNTFNMFKHDYPRFNGNVTEVKLCRLNNFVGSKCISKLKLVCGDTLPDYCDIDLTGLSPIQKIAGIDDEDDELWED
jgi:hypothetical protein